MDGGDQGGGLCPVTHQPNVTHVHIQQMTSKQRLSSQQCEKLTFNVQAVEDVHSHCINLQLTGALFLHLIQD